MRHALYFFIGIIGICFWGFGDLFISDSVLGYISPFHHELPERAWFYSNLKDGIFAWVYPYNDLGLSLLSDPTVSIVYLPTVLYAWWPILASKLLLLVHYLLLGWGLWRWISRSLSPVNSIAFTLMLLTCGLWWSLPEHLALGSAAYVPWAVTAWQDFWKSPSHREALLAGFFSGMILILGDPFLVPLAFLLGFSLTAKFSLIRYAPTTLMIFLLITAANLSEMLLLMPYNARSAGLSSYEILSYSTHPGRLLEMLLPWKEWSSSMGEGFQHQWWFPHVGVGLVLTTCLILGLTRWKQLPLALLLTVGFLFLSFGQFFAPSAWLFENILSFIRFPERFLLYSLFASIPLMVAGMAVWPKQLPRYALAIALVISFSENLLSRPRPVLAPAEQFNSWKTAAISQIAVKDTILPSRVWACHNGVNGTSSNSYWDLGAYGVAMANAESSTLSKGLKALACPAVLSPENRLWLGTGILLTAPTTAGEKETLRFWQWRQIETTPKGEVWRANDASPLLASWIPSPATSCSGSLLMEAPPHWQSLSITVPPGCRGQLSLPWSYHPHSKATYYPSRTSSLGIEVKSATLGFVIPPGTEKVEVTFERPLAPILFMISLLTQLTFLGFFVWGRFLPMRKKTT